MKRTGRSCVVPLRQQIDASNDLFQGCDAGSRSPESARLDDIVSPHVLRTLLSDSRLAALGPEALQVALHLGAGLTPPAVHCADAVASELEATGYFPDCRRAIRDMPVSSSACPTRAMTRQGKPLPQEWLERFERFWSAYAFKHDRVGALTAWYKLEQLNRRAPVDFEAVIDGAARAARESAFRPNSKRMYPEGWLNDRRWDDDIDGGEYPADARALITLFNDTFPRAERVNGYSPARSDAIRAALIRMDLRGWKNYFKLAAARPELFDFVRGEVPITVALSPEMERRGREVLQAMRQGALS